MQLTFTVTIDDYDETSFEKQIVEAAASHLSKISEREAKSLVAQAATEQVVLRMNEYVDSILDGTFQPVDEWGQHKGPAINIKEMVKQKSANYLSQKVDSSGRDSEIYNSKQTRAEYLVGKVVEDVFTSHTKAQIAATIEAAKAGITNTVAKMIADAAIKAVKP